AGPRPGNRRPVQQQDVTAELGMLREVPHRNARKSRLRQLALSERRIRPLERGISQERPELRAVSHRSPSETEEVPRRGQRKVGPHPRGAAKAKQLHAVLQGGGEVPPELRSDGEKLEAPPRGRSQGRFEPIQGEEADDRSGEEPRHLPWTHGSALDALELQRHRASELLGEERRAEQGPRRLRRELRRGELRGGARSRTGASSRI